MVLSTAVQIEFVLSWCWAALHVAVATAATYVYLYTAWQ